MKRLTWSVAYLVVAVTILVLVIGLVTGCASEPLSPWPEYRSYKPEEATVASARTNCFTGVTHDVYGRLTGPQGEFCGWMRGGVVDYGAIEIEARHSIFSRWYHYWY